MSNDEIKIDDNIPPPQPRPQFKKHLDRLEVGQSFRVEIEQWASLRNAAGNANRQTNKQFTVKKVRERPKPREKMKDYARVWRVK